MAERLGTGLQNLVQRFDSAWHLKFNLLIRRFCRRISFYYILNLHLHYYLKSLIFAAAKNRLSVMEETTQLLYEAPATNVVELSTESVILQASGGDYPGWNEENI